MRLSWNEARARAAVFADEWLDAAYEKGESQSFYNAVFAVFAVFVFGVRVQRNGRKVYVVQSR